LFAVAFTRVPHVVHILGVQRNETETVAYEFIGEDCGVGFYLYEVDGHGGDFGEDDAP
jgi:hypothetical protein